jgi:phosphoglycerate dehydrogenase-like enzyme
VVGEEPLPTDSPLWDLPNTVITPHDSSRTQLGLPRTIDQWLKNLAHYVRGEELEHVAQGTGVSEAGGR